MHPNSIMAIPGSQTPPAPALTSCPSAVADAAVADAPLSAAAAVHHALPASVQAGRPVAGKHVAVAGATGLVGVEIVLALLSDTATTVHTVGRRPLALSHPRLLHHTWHLDTPLPSMPAVTQAYVALGTTLKAAGSQTAFSSIDHDAVVAFALAAKASGATHLGVVSALGAHAGSRTFYNRVKGLMERDVSSVGIAHTVFAQPSLLRSDRGLLGQPPRRGETLGLVIARVVGRWLPAGIRPIGATQVAQALIQRVQSATQGVHRLSSAQMQAYKAVPLQPMA
jgi:uncharacterized protein YbjT (DUF2867 family)